MRAVAKKRAKAAPPAPVYRYQGRDRSVLYPASSKIARKALLDASLLVSKYGLELVLRALREHASEAVEAAWKRGRYEEMRLAMACADRLQDAHETIADRAELLARRAEDLT